MSLMLQMVHFDFTLSQGKNLSQTSVFYRTPGQVSLTSNINSEQWHRFHCIYCVQAHCPSTLSPPKVNQRPKLTYQAMWNFSMGCLQMFQWAWLLACGRGCIVNVVSLGLYTYTIRMIYSVYMYVLLQVCISIYCISSH